MILDTALVTFTAGTVTYEFLLAPLLAAGGTVSAILTSIAWASGGVAVLWLILVQMLRRARFPLATAGPIMAGFGPRCVANGFYAPGGPWGGVPGGGGVALRWGARLPPPLAAAATAERNLRLVMESVPDAITVLDREGRVTDLNPPARAMMSRQGDLQPGSAFDSLDDDAAKIVRAKLAAAFQGEVQRFDLPFLRGDGTKGHSTVVYAPVRESGRVTRVLALARDVTDQKRTESQLQQAEKLAAMGQLVSGVAHEINNPAAIISGFAQTLLLDELKPEHREMVQMVYDEATRIGR